MCLVTTEFVPVTLITWRTLVNLLYFGVGKMRRVVESPYINTGVILTVLYLTLGPIIKKFDLLIKCVGCSFIILKLYYLGVTLKSKLM